MTIDIVQGASRKPAASARLVEILRNEKTLSGRLFIGYPIIATATGRHPIDALWLSRDKGIIVFDLVEGSDPGEYQDRQDDSANKIDARLRLDRRLVIRRNLRIPIHTISFAPQFTHTGEIENTYRIADANSIGDELQALSWPDPHPKAYEAALSVIENVSTIRQTGRRVAQGNTRGAILRMLEDSIATLDPWQSRAVVETVDGVQRIRGLAGSGKTIVLALKATYLHVQQPDWRIAVTFHTRSLKGAFQRLIRDFHIRMSNEEPDWSRLSIVNAWGAPRQSGIYSEFCREQQVDYLDYGAAKGSFGLDAFAGACNKALRDAAEIHPVYDALLVDEAQDLPSEFLLLCYHFLKNPKRLIYAYDELQILSGDSLPPPEEMFGRREDGRPRVHLDERQQDIVLNMCYRNSRPILVTAHALGFGIYRRLQTGVAIPQRRIANQLAHTMSRPIRTGLVQMFDHAGLWEDVGYRVRDGRLEDGHEVALYRPKETSPLFLEDHSPLEDIVQFHVFGDEQQQARWLSAEIKKNLEQDELRHDDIMVINPDPRSTRKKAGLPRRRMLELGIESHLAGVDTERDVFTTPEMASVTFTGVHRAKGNEAAMVYVINAQDCQTATYDLARIRNRLFTAITRSKAWVRVLGVGTRMNELKQEYERLVANDLQLRFTYPSAEEREELRLVHRDMTAAERDRIEQQDKYLRQFLQDVRERKLRIEDIDPGVRDELAALLSPDQ